MTVTLQPSTRNTVIIFLLVFRIQKPQNPKYNIVSCNIETLPRNGDCGDSAGLSDADDSRLGVASPMQHLRELGALSRAGLSDDHHHWIPLHRLYDLFFELEDREVRHWWTKQIAKSLSENKLGF